MPPAKPTTLPSRASDKSQGTDYETLKRRMDVEVKPGTQPGTEIRLRGRGVPHLRRAGARGDLHVIGMRTDGDHVEHGGTPYV